MEYMALRRTVVFLSLMLCCALTQPAQAEGIILLIGDGMGANQVASAGMFAHGFESMPTTGTVATFPAGGGITDSAAASTAMATGVKVANGVIAERTPGDGSDIPTILEQAKAAGWSTGLVTTSYILDATPAAFASHAGSRYDRAEISQELIAHKPEILIGGGYAQISASQAAAAGYAVSLNRADLFALDAQTTATFICGLYGSAQLPYESDGPNNYPHLHEMAQVALNKLSQNPDGFFAMIEGGNIDHGAHNNNIAQTVGETVEFSDTVQYVLDWAVAHPDTLVIVTADHETGGLQIVQNNGVGVLPTVTWSTDWHTSQRVGIYAQGPGSAPLAGTIDNTDIYRVMKAYLDLATTTAAPPAHWTIYEP